jgi:hypothetical protein
MLLAQSKDIKSDSKQNMKMSVNEKEGAAILRNTRETRLSRSLIVAGGSPYVSNGIWIEKGTIHHWH